MITKVEVVSSRGDILPLSLVDPSNGFLVEDIQGLDPVKATLVSSAFANMDGEQPQSKRREKRNIILVLGFDPDFASTTVGILRSTLYSFLMPKTEVLLRFYIDGLSTVVIPGTVESFDSPQFTDDPKATISILNFDPDFVNPTSTIVSGNTTAGTGELLVPYKGTVEAGGLFTLNVNRPVSEVIIYSRSDDSVPPNLDFVGSLVAGDVLKISTLQGNKYATLTRAGVDSSVLYGVSPFSSWIELEPGNNYFRVYAVGAAIPWTFEYSERFGGL